jgi:Sulfatase-modifying factor enzyme 1
MKKLLSSIGDPESVPLRIEFDPSQRLNDEQLALSVGTLAACLDAFPDRIWLPSEVIVVSRDIKTIVLLVEWVDESEAHRLFHCVEQAFPNAVLAHLGSDALGQEFTITRLPDTPRRLGYELVSGRYVVDHDGVPKLVPPFWHFQNAVRVREFERFVEDTGYQTTAELEYEEEEYKYTWRKNALIETLTAKERSNQAVTLVSKIDALAYCDWASVRLPTEQEWLAAHIGDWCPLDKHESQLNAKRKRLYQRSNFGHQGGWWTSTLDTVTGKSIVRYEGDSLLKSDWNWKSARMECEPDFTELLVSFDVVRDL